MTAEIAVALPALVLVALVLVWVVGVAAAYVRCGDAAREAARALGRGDATTVAVDVVRRIAPAGASVDTATSGSMVEVTVRAVVRPPGVLGRVVPAAAVSGSASAWLEAAGQTATGPAPQTGASPGTGPAPQIGTEAG